MVMNAFHFAASGRIGGQGAGRLSRSESGRGGRVIGNLSPEGYLQPLGEDYPSSAGCDCCNHFPEWSGTKASGRNDSLTFQRNHPTDWFG